MVFQIIRDIESRLKQEFPGASLPDGWEIIPERCPEGMDGELVVNVFRFAGRFGVNPAELAGRIAAMAAGHPDVERAVTVKAFLNLTLKPEALFRDAAVRSLDPAEGRVPERERKRILIEYSAPNTNKPQHLGHVRNNTIGMALTALLRRAGHDTIPINLVNDRGIHICKSMLAYRLWGNGETPESSGIKGDHLVGKYYVEFARHLAEEVTELKRLRPELADKDADELFLETDLGQEAQEMLRRWEAGDPEVRELWKKMNSWVFEGFAATYRRYGVEFAHTYLESETYLLGKDLIADGLARGVFFEREDGAVCADCGKLGVKVVLRSDKTSVYITQDIGTTVKKYEDWHPDTQMWVVGDEQNLHFKILFDILRRLGYRWADDLHHLSYGMVNLPSGKMKSREGTVVDADDLFDEMSDLALAACRERLPEGADPDDPELRNRAEMIGLGALKFMLLKFNSKTTIMFDPAASIRFDGDTGAYVQYAAARIKSIVDRAGEELMSGEADWSLLTSPAEKRLGIELGFYPQTIVEAARKLDCSVMVSYLLELAKAFNRFYRECPVLNAENPGLRRSRLRLISAVREVLSDGLKSLTIGTPDAM